MVSTAVPNRDNGNHRIRSCVKAPLKKRETPRFIPMSRTGHRNIQQRTIGLRGNYGFLRTLEPGYQR